MYEKYKEEAIKLSTIIAIKKVNNIETIKERKQLNILIKNLLELKKNG